MKATILIIDDDAKLNQLLIGFLGDFGFNVVAAVRPEDGLKKIDQEAPDLIILDVMLPGITGFELCKKIRESYAIPIIMLTARGEVTDKIVGLELGADDYLPKPFEPRELVARIQSVLRRARGVDKTQLKRFGRLEIDLMKRSVKLDGTGIELTTNEFAVLTLLAKNKGKVLSRDEILEALKGIEWDAFNRTVDITMSRLRHKLNDDPKNPSFIKTVWAAGYLFIGDEDQKTEAS